VGPELAADIGFGVGVGSVIFLILVKAGQLLPQRANPVNKKINISIVIN
jgi:hypothetical protein